MANEDLARALLSPAARPMGNRDLLAELLRRQPVGAAEGGASPIDGQPMFVPPSVQSAEGREMAPMPRSFGEAGQRMSAVLRGDVTPTPEEGRQIAAVRGFTEGPASIRAFHGSPHRFDRFDMSRIGTGEGAQAYGHGLYFAGNENVARGYRDALSPWSPARIDPARLATHRPDDLAALVNNVMDEFPSASAPQIAGVVGDRLGGKVPRDLAQIIREAKEASRPAGHMYEVRLNTTPDRLLDWDKPLSAQPESVQAKLANLANRSIGPRNPYPDMTGGQWYADATAGGFKNKQVGGMLAEPLPGTNAPAIDGIQYLDAGSRATAGGELLGITQGPKGWQAKIRVDNRGGTAFGDPTQQITTSRPFQTQADAQAWADSQINAGTRNYVMFDDKLIDIMRRYGLAGLMALGASQTDFQPQPEQQ
jgi:hypothetical protein